MLCIGRRNQQKVYIDCPNGQVIYIQVLELGGGKVRLGISAPREYVVDREEVRARRLAGEARGTLARDGRE